MCIIAIKPAGIAMPNDTLIENMWHNNHDGAGFMYALDGKVHIEKGFMKLEDLKNALARVHKQVDLLNSPVIMHFRITTHGETIPANTHPFPITSSPGILQKLKCTTQLAVAHNGIIDSVVPRKDFSDTMEYVASQLAPLYQGVPDFLDNKHLMEMVDNAVASKLAFLTGDGRIYTIGQFNEKDGIKYSNYSYESYKYSFSSAYKGGAWTDSYLYDDAYGYEYRSRYMQTIFPETGDYLTDDRGKYVGLGVDLSNDYAVDEDGHVYKYDDSFFSFVEMAGYRAWDCTGCPLLADLDSEFTSLEWVYVDSPTSTPPWDAEISSTSKKSKKSKKKALKLSAETLKTIEDYTNA